MARAIKPQDGKGDNYQTWKNLKVLFNDADIQKTIFGWQIE